MVDGMKCCHQTRFLYRNSLVGEKLLWSRLSEFIIITNLGGHRHKPLCLELHKRLLPMLCPAEILHEENLHF